MGRHALAFDHAGETATAEARLVSLALHGHAERIAHLHVNNLANP